MNAQFFLDHFSGVVGKAKAQSIVWTLAAIKNEGMAASALTPLMKEYEEACAAQWVVIDAAIAPLKK